MFAKFTTVSVHATGDDNVHCQGFEVLVDRLVHHGRQFQTLACPNLSHSIGEGQNTVLHLRRAMWGFLRSKLLEPFATMEDEPVVPTSEK